MGSLTKDFHALNVVVCQDCAWLKMAVEFCSPPRQSRSCWLFVFSSGFRSRVVDHHTVCHGQLRKYSEPLASLPSAPANARKTEESKLDWLYNGRRRDQSEWVATSKCRERRSGRIS